MDRLETVRRLSRRALLAGGAAGLAALAGCRAPRTAADTPDEFLRWLYPPETVSRSPHAAFFALDVDRIEAHAGTLRPRTLAKYRGYVRSRSGAPVVFDPETVTGSLQVFPRPTAAMPQGVVLRGTFDTRALDRRLSERFPTRHRVDGVVVHTDGERAAALADGHLLLGAPVTAVPGDAVVRALLSARDGGPRYPARSPPLRAVLDALGDWHDLSGRTHPPTDRSRGRDGRFEGEVARGHRYRFRGERTDSRYAFAFSDPAVAADARPAVERWVAATDRLFAPYRDVTILQEGRLVVVDGGLPTSAV